MSLKDICFSDLSLSRKSVFPGNWNIKFNESMVLAREGKKFFPPHSFPLLTVELTL